MGPIQLNRMAKKSKKLKRISPVIGGKARKLSKKAKRVTKKTKVQAAQTYKSVSEQVKGTKEHEQETIDAPRITTETVAEQREKVLSDARRFIYPLQSRRRVAFISLSILLGVFAFIVVSTGILLYGFQSTSAFAYNISRFVPFPVARVDGEFVSYENYLFEVRSSVHYLSNFAQEGVEVDSEEGQALVEDTKRKILEKIQRDKLAYQIARENGVTISNEEIDEQIVQFEKRGGIDQSEGTLESVLNKYYSWDIDDLRRDVKNQLVRQKLLPIVDEEANKKLDTVMTKVERGDDFSKLAGRYSDDAGTRASGGEIGTISRNDSSFSAQQIEAIFALKKGQRSQPVTTPTGYYIYKLNKVIDEDSVDISQIYIRFFDIDAYLAEQLEHVAHRAYIEI